MATSTAKLRHLRIAPRKVRIVADLIRGQPVGAALNLLRFTTKSAAKPQVAAFVDYYLAHAKEVASRVGYVPLPDTAYAKVKAHWAARKTGSNFQSAKPGQTIEQVMSQEK